MWFQNRVELCTTNWSVSEPEHTIEPSDDVSRYTTPPVQKKKKKTEGPTWFKNFTQEYFSNMKTVTDQQHEIIKVQSKRNELIEKLIEAINTTK